MSNPILATNKKALATFVSLLVLTVLSVSLFNNLYPLQDTVEQSEATKTLEEFAIQSNKIYATEGNVYVNDFKNEILKVFKTPDGHDFANFDNLRSSLTNGDTLKFKPSTYNCFFNNLLLSKEIYKCFMITKGYSSNLDSRFDIDTLSTGSPVSKALTTIETNKKEGIETIAAAISNKKFKTPKLPNRGAPGTSGSGGSR
jgi:hypothetical protein